MSERLTVNAFHGCSERGFSTCYFVAILIIAIALLIAGFYPWPFVLIILGLIFHPTIKWIYKCTTWKASREWRLGSDGENETDMTPMPSISSSIPQAPRPTPPLHIPSMSPPLRPRHITPPTSPTLPTNDPTFRYPLSLSAQLSRAYYSHSSSFSSPYIASQSLDRSRSNSSTGERSSSISPSAPYLSNYNHSGLARQANVETTTRHAASLQPPAYTEVIADDPGLPPHFYMTTATDEAPEEVFRPSSDGLPSYEVATSTWQAPVEEDPTPSDDGSMTND